MSWNYRIVRYKDGSGFGLHEVYYNAQGEAWAMTEEPVRFSVGLDEGPHKIAHALLMARTDARKRPVFEEPDKWAEPPFERDTTEPMPESRVEHD